MATVKITKALLMKAVEAEVRRMSFGIADPQITNINGYIKSGEAFEIEGIYVNVEPPKLKGAVATTPPRGIGKLRLAAVDGETR